MCHYHRSELSKLTGFSIEALRYYENQGLLNPIRDESNYRIYDKNDLLRLKFISISKEQAFSLNEIKAMIDAINDSNQQALTNIIDQHISTTEKKISTLKATLPKLHDIRKMASQGNCWVKNS